MPSRVCRDCQLEKPESDFYRRSRGGLFAECRACVSSARKRRYESDRETLKARSHRRARTHFGMFYTQMKNAEARGIEWSLSFEEWLEIWRVSGRLDQRGIRRGQYVMARLGDSGSYAVGNVKIITTQANIAERTNHASSIKNLPEKRCPNASESFGRRG